jgi:hypothetical protein
MNEHIIPTERHFTACASLAALGVQLKHLDVFGPIREGVLIAQKTVKHSPGDKLYDAFISLLAGAHGLVEINTRLRESARCCRRLLAGQRVQTNRWCSRLWTLAQPRM